MSLRALGRAPSPEGVNPIAADGQYAKLTFRDLVPLLETPSRALLQGAWVERGILLLTMTHKEA